MKEKRFIKRLLGISMRATAGFFSLWAVLVPGLVYAYSTPVGLSAGFGTLGAGASVSYNIENRLGVRIGANNYDFDRKISTQGVSYDAAIEISGLSGMLDWYPWSTGTRLTAGVVSNSSKALAIPRESNMTMDINGREINLADAGLTEVAVTFPSIAAYLGVGWGNAGRGGGLSFFTDIGVVFQSTPDAALNIENQLELGLTEVDIKAQEKSFENDLERLRFYPVITIGISYNL